MTDHPNLTIPRHAALSHKLSLLRSRTTEKQLFAGLLLEISLILACEASRDLGLAEVDIETPLERTKQRIFSAERITVVPILRAGLGMVDGFLRILPMAAVAHFGLRRNHHTLEPEEYFSSLPADLSRGPTLILDPMLATGGSACAAIAAARRAGATDMRFVCVVAAPEGVNRLWQEYPHVPVLAADLDTGLDANGYIRPGLGDAGDRLFGTE